MAGVCLLRFGQQEVPHLLFLTLLGRSVGGQIVANKVGVGSEKPGQGLGVKGLLCILRPPACGLAAMLPPCAQTPAAAGWPFLGDRGLQRPGDRQDGLWGQRKPTRAKATKAVRSGRQAPGVPSGGCPTEWAHDPGPGPQQGSEAALSITGPRRPGPAHRQIWEEPTCGRCLPRNRPPAAPSGPPHPAGTAHQPRGSRPAFDTWGGG